MIPPNLKQECQTTINGLEEDIQNLQRIINDKEKDIQDLQKIINHITRLERRQP